MKYLFMLFIITSFAHAEQLNTKPRFSKGDRVESKSCKTREGKDWVLTGDNTAKLKPIIFCGSAGRIIEGPHRTCAPKGENPCDAWSWEISFDKIEGAFWVPEWRLKRAPKARHPQIEDLVLPEAGQP